MKITRVLLAGLLTLASVFGAAACANNGGEKKPSSEHPVIEDEYQIIWSAPSTMKVLRDAEPYKNAESLLSVSAARGEYEAGQIVVYNKEVETENYSVKVSDLTCGSETFSASNVAVYVQKYLKTTVRSNNEYPVGYYPDAIVPYDNIVAAGENRFGARENQGFWFTVKVPENQPAGVYEGVVDIELDGTPYQVPMQVTVYDFSMPVKNNYRSAFAIWEDRDMLASGYPGKNPQEMAVKEYEFLLDYGITPTDIPSIEYASRGAIDANKFAKAAARYAKREDVASFRIPVLAPNRIVNTGALTDLMKKIAAACIVDGQVSVNAFEKGFFFVPEIDESQTLGIWNEVKNVDAAIKQVKKDVAAYLSSAYANVAGIEELVKSVLALQHVVTYKIDEKLVGGVDSWCPIISHYDSVDYRDEAAKRHAEYGEGMWWYTCIHPTNPYPSYHIDDTLVGARAMGWMQKDYDVEGLLYWSTNIYKKYDGSQYTERDVWSDPLAFPGANGDGFLTYPGVKYGIDGPIGSIRLETIRDGIDDWKYLTILEEKLQFANENFGTAYVLDDLVSELYESIYRGAKAYDDPFTVLAAREKVAAMIEALSAENPSLIVTEKYSAKSEKLEGVIYTKSLNVSVNGESVSGENGAYPFAVTVKDGTRFTAEIDGKSYGFDFGGKSKGVDSFEHNAAFVSDRWDITHSAEGGADGGGCVNMVLSSGAFFEAKAAMDYRADLTKAANISIFLYNEGESDADVTFAVVDGEQSEYGVSARIRKGKWTKVTLILPNETRVVDLAKIQKIQISATCPAENTQIRIKADNLCMQYR